MREKSTRLRHRRRTLNWAIFLGLGIPAAARAQPAGPPVCQRPNFIITEQAATQACGTLVGSGGSWIGVSIEERGGKRFCQFRWQAPPVATPAPASSAPVVIPATVPPPIGPIVPPATGGSVTSGTSGSVEVGVATGTVGSTAPAPAGGSTRPTGPGGVAGPPLLRITPNPSVFPTVAIGQTASMILTVANHGGSAAAALPAGASGLPPAFAVTGSTCPAALAPGHACTVTVKFAPTTVGTHAGAVTSAGVPHLSPALTLTGQAVGLPRLWVSSGGRHFGTTFVRGASGDATFKLINFGNGSTGPMTVSLTPALPNPHFKIIEHDCTALDPGGSCLIKARFLPTSRGAKQAQLQIGSGFLNGTIALSGSGWNTPAATPAPDLSVFSGRLWGYDCPVLAAQAEDSGEVVAQLAESRASETGETSLPGTTGVPVRVAVVDSAVKPFDSTEPDRYVHGKMVGETIGGLADGRVQIRNYLALPLENALSPVENYDQGGYFGTVGHLVRAIKQALADWAPVMATQRLVINLSLGWEPALADPLANLAVVTVLQRATCMGALVIAAAGNRNGSSQGPLYPARWESVEPLKTLSASTCEAQGFKLSSPPGPGNRPLVYAVGGLDARDLPLPVTRPRGLPARVAYGSGFVVNPSGADHDGIMSGTSLATAVVSGVAAVAWYYATPGVMADAVMNRLDTTGIDVGIARTDGQPGLARKIRLCSALAGLPGVGPCPAVTPPTVVLGSDARDVAPPADGGLTGQPCSITADEPCEAQDPVTPWVVPQPGWPGCKECRYDMHQDALLIEMTPDLESYGPTVMRFRSPGRAVDVRYEETAIGINPIRLPRSFWAGMGSGGWDARPQSGTVQFGVYVGGTFVAYTHEEMVVITR